MIRSLKTWVFCIFLTEKISGTKSVHTWGEVFYRRRNSMGKASKAIKQKRYLLAILIILVAAFFAISYFDANSRKYVTVYTQDPYEDQIENVIWPKNFASRMNIPFGIKHVILFFLILTFDIISVIIIML